MLTALHARLAAAQPAASRGCLAASAPSARFPPRCRYPASSAALGSQGHAVRTAVLPPTLREMLTSARYHPELVLIACQLALTVIDQELAQARRRGEWRRAA
jgi:hypothetical protein